MHASVIREPDRQQDAHLRSTPHEPGRRYYAALDPRPRPQLHRNTVYFVVQLAHYSGRRAF